MSRVKHLFAVVLAALMLCLLMPVAAFAEEASDGKMIVYAKLPSDWSDPHLWAWADDGTNAFDAWPGGEMEADSNNDGWYYCWIPEATNNIIINANDAAVQTSDYKLESKNAWVTVTDAENAEVTYEAPAETVETAEAPAAESEPTVAAEPAETKSNAMPIVIVVVVVIAVVAGGVVISKKKK